MRRSSAYATGSGRCRRRRIRMPIDKALAVARAPIVPAALLRLPRRPPVPRRRDRRCARRRGGGHRPDRRPTASARLVYRRRLPRTRYALYPDSTHRFTHFRKTNGYANQPLDGIWLRGPHLHNGSVPTLRDLLEPIRRCGPVTFYRGYDVFDQVKVGFMSDVPAGRRPEVFTRYDTTLAGQRERRTCATARSCRTPTSARSSST